MNSFWWYLLYVLLQGMLLPMITVSLTMIGNLNRKIISDNYNTAPQGSKFAVATLYLQNYSNGMTVAPDPGSWILVADNVTYSEVVET